MEDPGDAFEEWKRISAGRLCDYRDDLRSDRRTRRHPMAVSRRLRRSEGVPPPLHRRSLPDRRRAARLLPVAWEPFPEQPTAAFPFVLNTGRTVEHWHTRTKTANVPILERLSPNAWLEMNPRDARAWGSGRRTAWTSSRSAADAQRRAPGDRDHRSRPFLPFHYAEANANQGRRARSIRFRASRTTNSPPTSVEKTVAVA